MTTRHWRVFLSAAAFSAAGLTLTFSVQGAQEGILTGTVKSASGTPLEGVAVSAQLPGEPITTSVYTAADGRYFFPAMKSGKYNVWAQAIGLAHDTVRSSSGKFGILIDVVVSQAQAAVGPEAWSAL